MTTSIVDNMKDICDPTLQVGDYISSMYRYEGELWFGIFTIYELTDEYVSITPDDGLEKVRFGLENITYFQIPRDDLSKKQFVLA